MTYDEAMTQAKACEGVSTPMPRYQCHKEVWALKIVDVLQAGRNTVLLVEHPFAPIGVTPEWAEKHKPEAGGYYVQYKDGYTSYSPETAFEEGYTKT